MNAISFQQVTKTFASAGREVRALQGVSFDIAEGEFFGLLGPNGAGKTTLISILAGLSRATSGRVTVQGHDVVSDYAAARRALGVVPQELVFDPFFSVRETLRMGDTVEQMLNNLMQIIRGGDPLLGKDIRKLDDDVDALYTAIKL